MPSSKAIKKYLGFFFGPFWAEGVMYRLYGVKAPPSDTPPTQDATWFLMTTTNRVYRRRYEDVVFDEKSANTLLHSNTTPAPTPTGTRTADFLVTLANTAT
jgi:hypothetical protein